MPHSGSTVLLRIARLVFDEAVLSSVVHPTIADLQEEFRAAGSSRRRRLMARWRGYRAFWTLVLLAPVAFDGGAVRPRESVPLLDMVGRAAISTVVAIVVITGETKPVASTGPRPLPGTREISVVFPDRYKNMHLGQLPGGGGLSSIVGFDGRVLLSSPRLPDEEASMRTARLDFARQMLMRLPRTSTGRRG